MATRLLVCLAAALLATLSPPSARAQSDPGATARESRIVVGKTSLYSREIGRGQSIIVLHGGPDFDHRYLLPDLDRLADTYRLIYYDQRGRGLSADQVQPEDVSMASEIEDLDRVSQHYGLESAVLLGHSWGAVLALEYALRHPERVSRLILANPAPASTQDVALFRKFYAEKMGAALKRQREIVDGAAYREGDPEAVAARYRLNFRPAFYRADEYEKLMTAMKAAFFAQGKEGILKARAVENRLMRETWEKEDYDLLPKLRNLNVPTLVIAGDQDFIPISVQEHIARAVPHGQLVVLKNCGHFAYMECPGEVRAALQVIGRQ